MKQTLLDQIYKQNDLEVAMYEIHGYWEYASDMYEFILDNEGNEMGKFRVLVEWISNDEEIK